jgi:hypothetical protein
MSSLPKIPSNVTLGQRAEKEIAKRLLHFSVPNKVEFDSGIDFYCDLKSDDSPTILFGVQAKGTEHFDKKWDTSIDKSTVMYWLTRDFPVFLIVYDEPSDSCYWMSIEDKRYELLDKMKTTSSTIYITVDRSHSLEDRKDANRDFIAKLIENVHSLEMYRGTPKPIGTGCVKRIPLPPRNQVELITTRESVRMGIYSLIQHYWGVNDLDIAYNCCEFLAKFDKSHYNHFAMLGEISSLKGDKQRAKEAFREALDICERDKNWPSESMKKIKEYIKMRLASVEELS